MSEAPEDPVFDQRIVPDVFRAYIFNYLKNHPKIHQDMTLIVRQLQPGPTGLPLEIYAFTNVTEWSVYEDIQADIFDHLLAIAGEFGIEDVRTEGTDPSRVSCRSQRLWSLSWLVF